MRGARPSRRIGRLAARVSSLEQREIAQRPSFEGLGSPKVDEKVGAQGAAAGGGAAFVATAPTSRPVWPGPQERGLLTGALALATVSATPKVSRVLGGAIRVGKGRTSVNRGPRG